MKGSKTCELCSREAALYCMSDSAFLCWSCDVQVHQANFLVARHVRRTICGKCKEFDGNHLSGVGFRPCPSFCQSCSNDGIIMSSDNDCGDDDNLSCISSSTCISSAESVVVVKKITTQRVSAKVSSSVSDIISGESLSGNSLKEKNSITKKNANKRVVLAKGILVNWCRKLSTNNNNVSSIHKIASHAFSTCLREMTYLSYRVSLATSMWLALKFCGASTCQDLKRVQDVSGVPIKLILIGEKKMGRVLKMNGSDRIDLEEGWAECDD